MKDKYLELLTDWRYTRVKAGDKIPFPKGWQNTHLQLDEIPQNENIGVLLGEASNGLMALDFDGPSSWEWFEKNIGCNLPTTVAWTSGKDARCQMAFIIPKEYWPYITTKKVTTKEGDKSIGLKPEQMEFRWNGGQSVLPPSVHPEYQNGYNYEWLNNPQYAKVAPLPDAILSWLLTQGLPEPKQVVEQKTINTISSSEFTQLEENLKKLKHYYPTLAYDDWLSVTFATASEVGDQAAAMLLQNYWPEEKRGEYLSHLRGRDAGRSPTVGTIVHMIRQHEPNYLKPVIALIKNNLQFKEKQI